VRFLAYNVDVIESLNHAFEMGFHYFQGAFYIKPNFRENKDVPFSKMNHLLLLQEINDPDVRFDRLSDIIKRDVSLSYRLLKYINSAYFGFPNKIHSIKYALSLLGLVNIRKWLSQVSLYELGKDKPEELVIISIVRARFCELLAEEVGLHSRASEAFLMGLFSLLDGFLDMRLEEILESLPISEAIKNALLDNEDNVFRKIYELVQAYENGAWRMFAERSAALAIKESKAPVLFFKAIEWAHQIF